MTRLILVPTQMERNIIEPIVAPRLSADDRIELCGFGLVAAAASTAHLVSVHQPAAVLLTGIAGAFGPSSLIGTAMPFGSVTCVGIGVGSGTEHISAGELGWEQCAGLGDSLPLSDTAADRLLSVTAASASADEARARRERFPDATAEDMEGYGVALACRLSGAPLRIVRGISNVVGDRDKSSWQIDAALEAAGRRVAEEL